jgi:hypothetical protein
LSKLKNLLKFEVKFFPEKILFESLKKNEKTPMIHSHPSPPQPYLFTFFIKLKWGSHPSKGNKNKKRNKNPFYIKRI